VAGGCGALEKSRLNKKAKFKASCAYGCGSGLSLEGQVSKWRCCNRPRTAGCWDRRMRACGSLLRICEWQVGVVLGIVQQSKYRWTFENSKGQSQAAGGAGTERCMPAAAC
jgi:hypothetical protein